MLKTGGVTYRVGLGQLISQGGTNASPPPPSPQIKPCIVAIASFPGFPDENPGNLGHEAIVQHSTPISHTHTPPSLTPLPSR